MSRQPEVLAGYTAHTADIPVSITDNQVELYIKNYTICSFCILDPQVYKEKVKSLEEREREDRERQRLADLAEPLARTMIRKERKIVGWSQNLLVNASGEVCCILRTDASCEVLFTDNI